MAGHDLIEHSAPTSEGSAKPEATITTARIGQRHAPETHVSNQIRVRHVRRGRVEPSGLRTCEQRAAHCLGRGIDAVSGSLLGV